MRLAVTTPPPAASLRARVVEVLDQGPLNSCTMNAVAQAVRVVQCVPGTPVPPLLSRLFGYYNARAYTHDTDNDLGTTLRQTMKGLAKFGFCPEASWGYVTEQWATRPPWGAYKAAVDQRLLRGFYSIDSFGDQKVLDVKRAIASGYSLVFGTDVTRDFVDDMSPPVSGFWDTPADDAVIAGGHAMCGVEYDEQGLVGPGSWGTVWGDKGWFRLTWDYVKWSRTRDLWVIEAAPWVDV